MFRALLVLFCRFFGLISVPGPPFLPRSLVVLVTFVLAALLPAATAAVEWGTGMRPRAAPGIGIAPRGGGGAGGVRRRGA